MLDAVEEEANEDKNNKVDCKRGQERDKAREGVEVGDTAIGAF